MNSNHVVDSSFGGYFLDSVARWPGDASLAVESVIVNWTLD